MVLNPLHIHHIVNIKYMDIIAIAIQKGGSGKTTTALNLAAAFRDMGQNTLLLDLDPQCNLTQSMGIRNDPKPSIYNLLDETSSGEAVDLSAIIRDVNGIPFIPEIKFAPILPWLKHRKMVWIFSPLRKAQGGQRITQHWLPKFWHA